MEAMDGSWDKEEPKRVSTANKNKVFRFLAHKGDEDVRLTIFQEDDPPMAQYEHICFTTDKSFPEFAICPRRNGGDSCPLCDETNYPNFVRVLGGIVHEYKSPDGKIYPLARRAIVITKKDQERIAKIARKRRKSGLSMVGATFEISRDNVKGSSPIGNVWDKLDDVSLEELDGMGADLTPITINDVFIELSDDELNELASRLKFKKADKEAFYKQRDQEKENIPL